MLKAQYQHDCEACVLIGTSTLEDVYYCPNEGSIVARQSNWDQDYQSFPMSTARCLVSTSRAWEQRVALAEAYLAGRTSAEARLEVRVGSRR